jgi:hypothetical protein
MHGNPTTAPREPQQQPDADPTPPRPLFTSPHAPSLARPPAAAAIRALGSWQQIEEICAASRRSLTAGGGSERHPSHSPQPPPPQIQRRPPLPQLRMEPTQYTHIRCPHDPQRCGRPRWRGRDLIVPCGVAKTSSSLPHNFFVQAATCGGGGSACDLVTVVGVTLSKWWWHQLWGQHWMWW